MNHRIRRSLCAAPFLLGVFSATANAATATIPCDSVALGAAIADANAGGPTTLSRAPACTYVLSLASPGTKDGLPMINHDLAIAGNCAKILPHGAADFRIFQVSV